jgi:hypothetical protein
MKDKIIFADKDKFSDRFMQPDCTAFYRQDSCRQISIDKKENKNFPRFAFLKISKIRFAAHLLVAAFGGWASPTTSKRAAIFIIV